MELYCIDCGAPIKYSGRGRPPVYCAECRKQHDKLTKEKAYRKWRESEKGQEWWSEYMKSDSRKEQDRKYYQNNKQCIKFFHYLFSFLLFAIKYNTLVVVIISNPCPTGTSVS